MEEKIEWIIQQHTNTNHMYDKYLPYSFHLRMVVQVFIDFKHLLKNVFITEDGNSLTFNDITLACYGHDLIEDTRVSYNDVKKELGQKAADIIYAVTNEKGKVRSERANSKYYEGIRKTEGATFVKLCDRIANVQYGILTKSSQLEMYKKENIHFITSLKGNDSHPLSVMFNYLTSLL